MDGTSEFPSRRRWRRASPRSPRADRRRGPLRHTLGEHVRTGAMASASCSTPRTATTAPASSSSRSAWPSRGSRTRPASSTSPTTSTRGGADLRGQAAVHHRQAEHRLRAGQRAAPLGQPHRARLAAAGAAHRSTRTRWPASGRATCSPFEDRILGGGVFILNASIERIERVAERLVVHTRRSDNGAPSWSRSTRSSPRPASVPAAGPARRSGVTVFGQSRLPAMTNY